MARGSGGYLCETTNEMAGLSFLENAYMHIYTSLLKNSEVLWVSRLESFSSLTSMCMILGSVKDN